MDKAKVENFELYKIGQKNFEKFRLSISIDRKSVFCMTWGEGRRGLRFHDTDSVEPWFGSLKLGPEALPGTFCSTGLLNPTTSVSATRSLDRRNSLLFEIGVSVRRTKLLPGTGATTFSSTFFRKSINRSINSKCVSNRTLPYFFRA